MFSLWLGSFFSYFFLQIFKRQWIIYFKEALIQGYANETTVILFDLDVPIFPLRKACVGFIFFINNLAPRATNKQTHKWCHQ